jgi:hypothetical protein
MLTIRELEKFIEKGENVFYALQSRFPLPPLPCRVYLKEVKIDESNRTARISFTTETIKLFVQIVTIYDDDPFEDYYINSMKLGVYIISKDKRELYKILRKRYPRWMHYHKFNDKNPLMSDFKMVVNKLKTL